jgi:hypothetical protein
MGSDFKVIKRNINQRSPLKGIFLFNKDYNVQIQYWQSVHNPLSPNIEYPIQM